MLHNFYAVVIFLVYILFAPSVLARCAVCYTKGMSGASIAVLVILSCFLIFFAAHWTLKKILDRF